MKTESTIACFVAALTLFGCHRDKTDREKAERESARAERPVEQLTNPNDRDRAGTTFLTGASWVANEVAIDRIVRSRCAREMTCDAVGASKRFENGDACLQATRKDVTSNLKASECPAGIDGAELDACVSAIRDESCDKSVDARSQVGACRANRLCLRVEMPHR